MNPVILIFSALIVVTVFGMALALYLSNRASAKERKLAVIQGHGGSGGGAEADETERQNKRRADLARKLKENELQNKKTKRSSIADLLVQAGGPITVKQFWIASLISGLVLAALSLLLGQAPFVVLMVFITGFLGLPRFILKRKVKKRQKQFLEEFADALEAMTRLLKSGMPVSEAISMAAREYKDSPVGEEMMRVYDEQRVGVPLPEAVGEAAKRMPLTEMQMFATGIAIQSQTGSSLSEVLMGLAGVIRARFRLKRKVQALSSEAKASAMIIGSLPFLVGGGLFAINPDYINVMLNSLIGQIMLGGCIVWMGIGIFVMKIMINFKI